MGNSSAYNREYYLKNRAKIARRKNYRYQNDDSYREAILERRSEQRAQEKEQRRKKATVPRTQRPPKKMKVTLTTGEKVVVDMYTLGQLAHVLGLSTQTLRKWEANGVLPSSTYRSKGGHRLYTGAEVDVLLNAYSTHHDPNERWLITDEFINDIKTGMDQLIEGTSPE